MGTGFSLNNCCVCGEQLAPDDFDGICSSCDEFADDGLPLDYKDESGMWWVMCACGHRVGGSPRPGDKIALCVNCRFLGSFDGKSIDVVYPDRLPDNGAMEQQGDHPDHVAWRAERAKRDARNAKAKERRRLKKEEEQKSYLAWLHSGTL